MRWRRLKARLKETFAFELRPASAVGSAAPQLRGLLASADSPDKKAVLIGRSEALADHLGLASATRLNLDFPDFTIENLGLLSDEYDFIIADRMLHHCGSISDAGSETMRVLKPGGWFVHTAGRFDFDLHAGFDRRRSDPSALRGLFPYAMATSSGRAGSVTWIAGRKSADSAEITPTIATRKLPRPWYRFRPRKAKFGVMAMMRNEAPYLLEWIAYHRLLGFEQITLYDNESNDASARILAPLARAGIINAVFWPDRQSKQLRAYNHAVRRLRSYVDWCLFVDLDEFLVLAPGMTLDDLLPREPDAMGVSIPWRLFGSSGIRNRGTDLTIARFTKVAQKVSRHVKSIVRLRDVKLMGVHMPPSITGRLVDTSGATVTDRTSGRQPWVAESNAWINHYFSRSLEEYESKRARGRGAVTGAFRSARQFDAWGAGEVENRDILAIAPALREEIARLRAIVRGNAT